MEGQDKTPGKQLNEVETGNLPEKRIQNNDSEDDPGSLENNGKEAKNVYQRTKEQAKRNNTLEGINSRLTEAEEQINDLEDRMVEITTTKQNIEKRMEKKMKTP